MVENSDPFLEQLIETFNIEAEERIQNITTSLLTLESTNDKEEIKNVIEIIYREYHSLKSAARAVNFTEIETICQALESEFSIFKESVTKPSAEVLDKIHKKNDILLNLLEKRTHPDTFISEEPIKASETRIINKTENTVRIPVSKLDSLLVDAEEMLSTKINLENRILEFSNLKNEILKTKTEWGKILADEFSDHKISGLKIAKKSKKEDLEKKLFDFIALNENFFHNLSNHITDITNKLDLNLHSFNLGTFNLLENTKKLLLLPFSIVLEVIPKIIRDLSRAQGKEIKLNMMGSELEIDKRILEEIKDVLLHIIRNAIDHGIELPEERQKNNKSEIAMLNIHIQHMTGNAIQIQIQDDGRGIDIEAVKKSAIDKGIITEETSKFLSQAEAISLIYHSGISTSKTITNLSGRGLGMSIIREKIEKVGGMVSVSSQLGVGTTITLQLPLTLATFKGILITANSRTFILPIANIERIIRIKKTDIKSVANKKVIAYDNQTVPLHWLADVLALPSKESKRSIKRTEQQHLVVLVLSSTAQKVSFVIDEVLNEQEILVKNFSKPISRVRNISAAAILDTGQPIPILNALDLLQIEHVTEESNRITSRDKKIISNKKILLAEDSITTRTLLKNILEIGGFDVVTAIDGLDAWEKVQSTDFNLVVSDIEMPRMSGFDLTQRIRQDKKLYDLKIILVTSKKDPRDREKGIDLGANAYLLKDTFDSRELLEIAQRLSA